MHVLERSVADGIKERLMRIEARPGREVRAAPVCLPKSGVSQPLPLGYGPSLHEICDRLESVIV